VAGNGLLPRRVTGNPGPSHARSWWPESDSAQAFLGDRYGLGIVSIQDSCGGYWAHAGDVLGWSTLNGVSPDGKRVVVLSMSSELADQTSEVSTRQRVRKLVDDTLCQR
jgi:D-alanyl-D-alanine carboxypeptidase